MNEIVKLLESLGLPALIIPILILILKSKPITFITSNPLERKMSSKEWSFSYKVVMYIWMTFIFSIILMTLSAISYKWDWLNNKITDIFSTLLGVTLISAFYLLLYLVEKGKIFEQAANWQKKLLVLGCVFLYSFGWLVFFTLIFGRKAFLIYDPEGISLSFGHLIGIFIAIFILSLILPVLFKPLSNYLVLSKENQFKVVIGDDTWFLLNPINKEEFLLGNQPIYNECTILKIMNKETLLENQFEVEKTQNK